MHLFELILFLKKSLNLYIITLLLAGFILPTKTVFFLVIIHLTLSHHIRRLQTSVYLRLIRLSNQSSVCFQIFSCKYSIERIRINKLHSSCIRHLPPVRRRTKIVLKPLIDLNSTNHSLLQIRMCLYQIRSSIPNTRVRLELLFHYYIIRK